MKRYKLLKDLPTLKAGEEFYINESGKLISVNRRPLVAYARGTLKKYPNILKDWFEEIKEGARWRGKIGQTYWWLNDAHGCVYSETENRDIIDNYRYRIGNYFKTEKEVKKYGKYLVALQTIKDDAKGFKPDWKDWDQPKYYGHCDHDVDRLECNNAYYYQIQGVIYFKTKEDLKESFEKHRKEWLIVLGVENENR